MLFWTQRNHTKQEAGRAECIEAIERDHATVERNQQCVYNPLAQLFAILLLGEDAAPYSAVVVFCGRPMVAPTICASICNFPFQIFAWRGALRKWQSLQKTVLVFV